MFTLDFEVRGDKEIIRALTMADRLLDRNINKFVRDMGKFTEQAVKEPMPVFDGIARDSIQHTTGKFATTAFALIYTVDDQAKMRTIEDGRRPGAAAPPAQALLRWVQVKWGGDLHDAYYLAQVIKQRGSHKYPEGHQPFEKGFRAAIPKASELAMDIVRVF